MHGISKETESYYVTLLREVWPVTPLRLRNKIFKQDRLLYLTLEGLMGNIPTTRHDYGYESEGNG